MPQQSGRVLLVEQKRPDGLGSDRADAVRQIAPVLGFQTPPAAMTGAIMGVVAIYQACAELLKRTAIKSVSVRHRKLQPGVAKG